MLTAPHRRSIRRSGGIVLTALTLCLAGSIQPAAAENFFEALFGGFQHRQPLPQQTSSYADPSGLPGRVRSRTTGDYASVGRGAVYCVRTCDGRYFPLQRHAGVSPAEQCHSFCPAAKTMVFSGSKIDHAVASNGTHYADLDNAFVYRDKVVDNCTCNGRDGLGLARIDTATDPTLRPGDIVATADGLVTYSGKNKTAEFTPINPSSSKWAHKLSEIKVRPAPPLHVVTPVADNDTQPLKKGRLQAAR